MQRLNIFDPAHHALRDVLYTTALRLQRTDVQVRAEAYAALVQVQRSLEQLEEHMRREATYVLDALFEYEAGIVDGFLQHQESCKAIIRQIKARLEEANQLPCLPASKAAWKTLALHYTELVSFSLQQMKKEEEVLNAILWCYFSHKSLASIQQQIEEGLHERQPRAPVVRALPTDHPKKISVADSLTSITLKHAL